ncbi:MAG: hypothetical protein ACMG6S_10485 [Byssovorax sp.]
MKIGETYVFRGHQHIIITDPEDDDARAVAVVNFTGHEDNKDQTCVVEAGEHPRVTKKTVVAYKYAFILRLAEQDDFVKQSTQREDVSPDLLARIQEGTDSDYIPEKVRRFVDAACRRYRLRNRPLPK